MKIAYGRDYKEAYINRPMTGILKKEFWEGISDIRKRNEVVLDFKMIRRVSVHEWVYYKRFCVKVLDKRTGQLVMNEKTGKPLNFKSITRAKEWIWEEDKEIYEKLENLSLKSSSYEALTGKETRGEHDERTELIF